MYTMHPTPTLGPQPFVSATMAKGNTVGRCAHHHDGVIARAWVTSEAQPPARVARALSCAMELTLVFSARAT